MLVKIVEVDISKNIIAGTYNVNEHSMSKDWQDGNWKTHKEIVRSKIAGNFTLKYNTESDYTAFINLIEQNQNNGILKMRVYVNNKNIEKDITAFFDYAPLLQRDVKQKIFLPFEFSLEEQ